MALKVVGAGLGRTGTHSLKIALEQLLGAPCYHMVEVIAAPEERAPAWDAAFDGKPTDWDAVMDGYVASVDWPACAFWQELADANPDAIILLSSRSSTDAWYKSADATIFEVTRRGLESGETGMHDFPNKMFSQKFTPDWQDADAAKRAYEAHNAHVRATAPKDRLVDWQPGDGWEPICNKLGVAVPDEPFPHVNTTDEFRAMLGLH
jgi:hypothetical protein